MMKTTNELRLEIAGLVQEFADLKYTEKTFKPGRSVVQIGFVLIV